MYKAKKLLLRPVRRAAVALLENPLPPQTDGGYTPVPQTNAPPSAAFAPAASTVHDYVTRKPKFALEMMSHAVSDEISIEPVDDQPTTLRTHMAFRISAK